MSSALTTNSPPEAKDEAVDDGGMAQTATGHERSVSAGEKNENDNLAADTDSSDQEAPKEFKEGGYGW